MNLYLDDDCAGRSLIQFLRRAGHDVRIPADAGLTGRNDAVHLRQSFRERRAIVTRNYKDFEELHDVLREGQGHHAGILVIRKDNDPKHDLQVPDIVRAIAKLQAAGIPIADEYIVLNHWR